MKPFHFLPRPQTVVLPAAVAPRAPAPPRAPRPDTEMTLDLREADRDAAIAYLFDQHHRQLVRLATLLGANADAEDVVAEAFYQLHRRWDALRTPEAAGGYLRATVCNLTRMRLRHNRVVRRHAEHRVEDHVHSAEQQVIQRDDHRVVIDALQTLPMRQRQALVLKYWLDLKEAEIAATMKISVGAVKSHTARGMAKLAKIVRWASQ